MLTSLDETLFHQYPGTFAMVSTSDHRFFDRYWFCGADPTGRTAFFAGLGRYANMGTRDGFLSVLKGTTQYNLRVATQPSGIGDVSGSSPMCIDAGPLKVEVVRPFREIEFSLDAPDSPVTGRLRFRSHMEPHLEHHHREMSGARILQDQQRYVQVGRWDGWIAVEGRREQVSGWWGDRDHSWGVRVDVGGLEPRDMSRRVSSFTIWCSFSTASRYGMFQFREYADGRPRYIDGTVHSAGGSEPVRVVGIEHEVDFFEGTKIYREVRVRLRLADGSVAEVHAEPLTERGWAARGGGYSRGFNDQKGFGARRGDVVEYDVYHLPDPETVLLNGSPIHAGHREQLVRLTFDGEPGDGHMTVMVRSGELPA